MGSSNCCSHLLLPFSWFFGIEFFDELGHFETANFLNNFVFFFVVFKHKNHICINYARETHFYYLLTLSL